MSLTLKPKHVAAIDPALVPASLWTREYLALCDRTAGSAPLAIALARPDGTASIHRTRTLPPGGAHDALNRIHVERTVKFLLWARGGDRFILSGAHAAHFAKLLSDLYRPGGERAFDAEFVRKLFDRLPTFETCEEGNLPKESASHLPLGRNLDGCRIGFDLGGSDRKCAALIDGKVVFSEEIKWDPYFQQDPQYHYDGILHSLELAAKHLPRVDAIGGSAAGVYINNTVRAASLFRGITDPALFNARVKNIFLDLGKRWPGVPFEVLNDGDVTALAASMSLNRNSVLGIAMGTSVAAGYVDTHGNLTNWLSELAFVPVDYRANGPADEWSGDLGCGVQYFSQQGVGRLLPLAGIHLPATMKLPEQLEELQKLMKAGDPRARSVYDAIGIAFGYALAHFADFYRYDCLLIMGRVTSGEGGSVIIDKARQVLKDEFPSLRIDLVVPDEKDKRHGQAIAAASLPKTNR